MKIKEILKKNETIHCMGIKIKKILYPEPSEKKMMKIISRYYINRFYKYSGAFNDTRRKKDAYTTWLYHVIEKGLSMPNMRLGFGKEKIEELCGIVREHQIEDEIDRRTMESAVAVLLEYQRIHEKLGYQLPTELKNELTEIKQLYPDVEPINQKEFTKEEFFKYNHSDFSVFSQNRHTVRNYTEEEVKLENIIEAIDLAKSAPSACNRQHTRVHIVSNKKLINQCLKMQSGNRGFGHLGNKLLVITGDLSVVLGSSEFFDLNTNVGIFIMNLCYSLHLKQIGCCVLNWYALPKQDKELRKILSIPNEENVVAFIICGNVPDQFKIAESPRLDVKEIYTVHD
ncbi:MAG: nitroreductase family protein [Clostridia bacterium]|nr:nitroreductase family protein [Clostridia bacterium]